MKAVALPLAVLFARPFALMVLLVACEEGKKDRPAPPPPRPPTPSGVLKGHVTATMNGPGRAHAPEESFSRTTPIECTVTAIDVSGKTFEAKSQADGGYELTVPIGHYDVSFNDCRGDRSCEVPTPLPTEVSVGSAPTVDWNCEMDAK